MPRELHYFKPMKRSTFLIMNIIFSDSSLPEVVHMFSAVISSLCLFCHTKHTLFAWHISTTELFKVLRVTPSKHPNKKQHMSGSALLTLLVVVDDVFGQKVVVAEDSGRVDLREVSLQGLHFEGQSLQAGHLLQSGRAARGQINEIRQQNAEGRGFSF